jgi:hypothetical protein
MLSLTTGAAIARNPTLSLFMVTVDGASSTAVF